MRPIRKILLAATLAALTVPASGCMTAAALYIAHEERENARLSEPAPAEYAWASAPGVRVTGVVHLPTSLTKPYPGGVGRGPAEVLTCEGHPVRLIPDTPHLRFVLDREFGMRVEGGGMWRDGFVRPDWDWPAESADAIRETTCTTGGAFVLDNVPDGDWLVMAQIDPPAYDSRITSTDTVLKAVTIRSQGRPVHLDVKIGGNDYLYGAIERKR